MCSKNTCLMKRCRRCYKQISLTHITTLWANHEEKWREFSPDDLSAASCHRYLTHRFFILKDLDPVSDPRKLQQLIAGIFRYTHQIRNMSRAMTAFEEALDEESHDQYVE